MKTMRAFACKIKRTQGSEWELAIRLVCDHQMETICDHQMEAIIDFECQPVSEIWDIRNAEHEGCFALRQTATGVSIKTDKKHE